MIFCTRSLVNRNIIDYEHTGIINNASYIRSSTHLEFATYKSTSIKREILYFPIKQVIFDRNSRSFDDDSLRSSF